MAATVVRADEHFPADHIGAALAKVCDVDGLMLRLQENVETPTCPITFAPILKNAGMIADGSIYQLGYIKRWLDEHDRSPVTNCTLPHRHVLQLSPLKAIVQTFLSECSRRRPQYFQQCLSTSTCTDTVSSEELELALIQMESYIAEASRQVSIWVEYIGELEEKATAMREAT